MEFVVSKNQIQRKLRGSICIFSSKICEIEGLGASPGGLTAVRFANLFPFPFAVRSNLFAMGMMSYGPSSASVIPSIFTMSLFRNKKHWILRSDSMSLFAPFTTEGWWVGELWSNPSYQLLPSKTGSDQ